ncbi:ac55-like protein [Alphabaculovirus altersperidaniae]|uniref:Ac55-like protein n=1 Tax=Spodoptera eridania nucleopolyhedrovirus TaxID=2315721 RepID=A0ABX6TPZ6_9ABAC|nr:ac55-like protein [Spodoptera eridania nucleopolyhedrovirus]QNV47829.1 ac55-like protein [Spodoptera eridania nucleopolyhedrovirus]
MRRCAVSSLKLVLFVVVDRFEVALSHHIVGSAAAHVRCVFFLLIVKRRQTLLMSAFQFVIDCVVDNFLKFEIEFAHFYCVRLFVI